MKPAFGRKLTSKPDVPQGTSMPEKHLGDHNRRSIDNTLETNVTSSDANMVDKAYEIIEPCLGDKISPEQAQELPRNEVVNIIEELVTEVVNKNKLKINDLEKRDLTTVLLNDLLSNDSSSKAEKEEIKAVKQKTKVKKEKDEQNQLASKESIIDAKDRLQPLLLEYIDAAAANEMDRTDLADQVSEAVNELMAQEKINLNLREQRELVNMLLHDMLGLGPLEPLHRRQKILQRSWSMVQNRFILKKQGKLILSDVTFQR